MFVYVAIAEDLTSLGGPIGTERTTSSVLDTCSTLKKAKDVCQKHWEEDEYDKVLKGKRNFSLKLAWIREKNSWRTDDLTWVMYHVKKVKVN